MNRKKTIIIAGVLIIAPLVAGIFWASINSTQVSLPADVPQGETIQSSGQQISNVYNTAKEVTLQTDAIMADNENYQIMYFKFSDEFLVTILGSPFESFQKMAERDLISQLKIDENTACRLKVSVTTPSFANPDEAGRTYGLSFCE